MKTHNIDALNLFISKTALHNLRLEKRTWFDSEHKFARTPLFQRNSKRYQVETTETCEVFLTLSNGIDHLQCHKH